MPNDLLGNLGGLRRIEEHELELMLGWRNAVETRAHMYTRHVISLTEHLAWWKRVTASSAHQYLMYAFNGEPRGIVAFTEISQLNQTSSWAFYASPDAPTGTGIRMEFLALEHAFSVLDLSKLWCEVLGSNPTVISLHQKFGFKTEHIFQDQHKIGDDFVDVYRLRILRNEWAERRQDMLRRILRTSR